MIIGFDTEYSKRGIDVLGLSWAEGLKATATDRNEVSLAECLATLHKASLIVTQNGIDADMRMMSKEGIDISTLEPKVYDIRLAMHAAFSHLAGSGSFDLRSIMLLLGARQGYRFPLEFKQYATDLYRTCSMDAAAALWGYYTLDRLIKSNHLEATLEISHRCQPIFTRMHAQGVRLDTNVLKQIHDARKVKTESIVEKYRLWEERGKKKIKRVPIWRSNKILDICQQNFGFKPASRQRKVWEKLLLNPSLSDDAREFVTAVIDLGKGANDAHWLGKAEETEDGLSFDKVDSNGFIFPRYDICGSPDRAIASGPNIQNFPRPSDDPREVKLRAAVIPLRDDHVILEVDLSAVETVTNAWESHDMDRVQAVIEKRVSHEGTAKFINETMGLSLNRTQGKIVNHGTDKGESPYNLARGLFKTDRPSRQQVLQCQTISSKMLAEYPKTAAFRTDLWERAKANPLTVTNSFGRRLMCFSRSKYGESSERYARHDPSRTYWCPCSECAPRRDRWKYAIAFLGRSSAFDALLRMMAKIWYDRRLDAYSLPYIEVHDSLAFSVPRDKAGYYLTKAKEAFEEPFLELGGISLKCEGAIGINWAQCK